MEKDVLELRETLIGYLSRMEDTVPEITSLYRSGKLQEAKGQMLLLAEGLKWVSDAVELTKTYHQLSAVSIEKILRELIESLENGDMLMTADLLEYELIPHINDWREQLVDSFGN